MTDKELIDKLRDKRAAFNPWLTVADEWLEMLKEGTWKSQLFVHPDDESHVREYKDKLNKDFSKRGRSKDRPKKKDKQLILDILPQPFIGNPCAPIWVLLRNPGYSAIDVYDLRSIDEGRQEIRKSRELKLRDLMHSNNDDEQRSLRTRQELVCRQLKFDFDLGKEFYILRHEFMTIRRSSDACKKKSRKVYGGYNWYKKYLLSDNGCIRRRDVDMDLLSIASKRLFVMEYDPYHSKAYFKSGVSFAHHSMWENLVKHGIKQKIVIARGGDILEHIVKSVPKEDLLKASNERRLFLFKGQSAALSTNNLYWPCLEDDPANPLARK